MSNSRLSALLLTGLSLGCATSLRLSPAYAQAIAPDVQVRNTFAELVDRVAPNRALYETDLCANFALVDEMLLDQFDFRAASERVLPDHWRDLSAAEQDRFVALFTDWLVARYGDVLQFLSDDTLEVDDLDRLPPFPRVSVTGIVHFIDEDEPPAHVVLRMQGGVGNWRIVDVFADNQSFADWFEDRFRAQIDRNGYDGFLFELEEEAAPRLRCGRSASDSGGGRSDD